MLWAAQTTGSSVDVRSTIGVQPQPYARAVQAVQAHNRVATDTPGGVD